MFCAPAKEDGTKALYLLSSCLGLGLGLILSEHLYSSLFVSESFYYVFAPPSTFIPIL